MYFLYYRYLLSDHWLMAIHQVHLSEETCKFVVTEEIETNSGRKLFEAIISLNLQLFFNQFEAPGDAGLIKPAPVISGL